MRDRVEDENKKPAGLTRRLLLICAAAVVLVLAPLMIRVRNWRGRMLRAYHSPAPPTTQTLETSVTEGVADFTGALHGRRLSTEEKGEIAVSLDLAARTDSNWAKEYSNLMRYINHLASGEGASSFQSATELQRSTVLARIMSKPVDSSRSEFLALLSPWERTRRRMRRSTIPQLNWLYRHTGIPWRQRGYRRWPGLPGDSREYTRAGPEYPCQGTNSISA